MSFLATFQTFDADTEETASTQEHFLSIADVSHRLFQLYTIHTVHTVPASTSLWHSTEMHVHVYTLTTGNVKYIDLLSTLSTVVCKYIHAHRDCALWPVSQRCVHFTCTCLFVHTATNTAVCLQRNNRQYLWVISDHELIFHMPLPLFHRPLSLSTVSHVGVPLTRPQLSTIRHHGRQRLH